MITIFLPIAFFMMKNATGTDAAWYDDSYAYRQRFSFTHNADVSTPRAVTFSLDTAELITAGNMQSDCDDTRFTDINGKLLQYELTGTCNNAATTYEVVFETIINGSNVGYVYYGNSAAATGGISVSGITTLTPSGGDPSITDVTNQEKGETPVSYWSFDDASGTSAQDSTVNNNDGTLGSSTAAPSWRPEEFCLNGPCLEFDGSNDVVTVTDPSNGSLDFGTSTDFSVSFWIRSSDTLSATKSIIRKDTDGAGARWGVSVVSGGYINAFASDGSNTATDTTPSKNIVDNSWHFITVVYSRSGSIKTYVDGKQDGAGQAMTIVGNISNTEDIRIMRDGSTNYMKGFLDEVKIYPYSRTASQIQSDYIARGGNEGSSVSLGQNNQKFLSDGLVGYWKMDETSSNSCIGGANDTCDSSGNGNDGAWNGDTTSTAGKFASGTTYDGTGDYLNMGDVASLEPTTEITVSAWFKSSGNTVYKRLVSKGVSTRGYELIMYPDILSGRIEFNLGINGAEIDISSTGSPALNDNNWHLATGTWDGQVVKVYVDGILYNTRNASGTLTHTSDPFNIGSNSNGSNLHSGSIDEARVYNRALSPAEVQALYEWAPGPVGYWKMDEGSGTTTKDHSGNGLTGTLNSTRWNIGKFGNTAQFVGPANTSYIRVTDTSLLDITSSFSITSWIYSTDLSGFRDIFTKTPSGNSGNYYFETTGTELICGFHDGTTWRDITTSGLGLQTRTWYHTACIFDDTSNTLTIYVNGKSILSTSGFTQSPSVNNSDLQIGDGYGEPFIGYIDEVKLYNYARSSNQIVQDMNAGHPLVGTPIAGPVAHWSFDEGTGTTANDNTPNDNDLTLSTASWTNNGKFGKSWNGTGSNWLSRADDADFDFEATDDFSISMWLKSDSATNPSSLELILGKTNNATVQGYSIYANTNGTFTFGIDDDTSYQPEDSATTTSDIYDGAWHHIIATKTGTSKIDLYVDGKLNASDTSLTATGSLVNSLALYLGDRDGSNNGDEFNGDIDEVKIYRAALSPQDVMAEYSQGKGIVFGSSATASDGTTPDNSASREYCLPGDTTSCSAPIAEWKFDESSGTTANDTSGNNYTGTLQNQARWASGRTGSGIQLDGNDDAVSTSLDIDETAAYSISFWVYPRSLSTDDTFFSTTNNDGVFYYGNDTALHLCNNSSCSNEATSTSAPLQTNQWNFISITYTGTPSSNDQVQIYVNGRNVTSDGNIGETAFTGGLIIGSYDGSPAYTVSTDGTIDQFRVYNYVRTQSQIAWEYNRGAPIAHWEFDECQGTTINDSTGNGYTGTLTVGSSGNTSAGSCNSGTSTHLWNDGTSGKYNSAAGFDGTDDYTTISNSSNLNIGTTTGMSISAWIYRTGSPDGSNGGGIAGKWSVNNGYLLWLGTDSSIQFPLDSGPHLNSGITASLNTWYHVVGTYSGSLGGSVSRIYVNGKLLATGTEALSLSLGAFEIGRYAETTSTNFPGLIDDVRLYNYPLTQTQINMIMNQSSAIRFGPSMGQP